MDTWDDGEFRLWVRGYRGEGFGSGFIKRFTFGEYSHVSLVFQIGERFYEIESLQGKGVIKHEPHSHSEKDFIDMVVPATNEQVIEAYLLAGDKVGCGYDYKGIWGFLVRKKKHNMFKFFCSELVAYILYKVGIALSRREPYRETPSTCMESKVIG